MGERTIRFRIRGLVGQMSEAEWPSHLPLPIEDLTVIEMPNSHHKGIAVDRNGEHYHCTHGANGYKWTLAEDLHKQELVTGYK